MAGGSGALVDPGDRNAISAALATVYRALVLLELFLRSVILSLFQISNTKALVAFSYDYFPGGFPLCYGYRTISRHICEQIYSFLKVELLL